MNNKTHTDYDNSNRNNSIACNRTDNISDDTTNKNKTNNNIIIYYLS